MRGTHNGSELRKRSGIPPRLTEIKIPEVMHQQRVKALNVQSGQERLLKQKSNSTHMRLAKS